MSGGRSVLKRLYDAEISVDSDDQITGETVQARLHDFDILQEKNQMMLERLNPEDLDFSPVDNHDSKYLRRGSNGGASA